MLCLAAAQPHAPRPPDTRFTPMVDALLPWILALALLAPLGSALDGGPRIFVVGLAAGVLVGAAFAWRLHVLDRATGLAATARVRAEISAESDARANSVLMQFEWAVNDIASLRTSSRRPSARFASTPSTRSPRNVTCGASSVTSGSATAGAPSAR
jgi:hypothetical protein